MQYLHTGSVEEDIVILSHRNTKGSSRPFFKTDPCVLERIQPGRETKPRRLFKKLVDDTDGSLYTTSASSEPRHLQQIYNIRSSTKASSQSDQMTHLWAQIKDSTFVREFAADSSSLQYIVVSQKQLLDLDTFCTHPIRFSVFSIDYVQYRCFENLRMVHASGKYKCKHPVEMGPTFVHTHHDTNSYVRFFSALQRMNPSLKHVRAVGTDGDEALLLSHYLIIRDL